MNINELGRILAAQNPGEALLVEISNALNAGKQPNEEAVQRLSEAVTAMLKEEDPQMRLNALQSKLDLKNPEGRPPLEKRTKKLEQGERMARAYWWYRLLGRKKGEAKEEVAGELERSGEFPEGHPSVYTVQKNIDRFPQQAKYAFYYWRILLQPDKDEIARAADEIQGHLNKSK